MITAVSNPEDDKSIRIFSDIMSAPELMNREHIENIIAHVLLIDGPDGHIDGYEEITDFIIALMNGVGEEWFKEYTGG